MKIYGAGIAGLLAGSIFQSARIYEAGNENAVQHKAVLRFRSSAVGDAVGIDFKKVRVHKGLYFNGDFVRPNIMLANMYSQKVIGRLADRSIWNLDPVDRYIAPEDFIGQLAERCSGRVTWNHTLTADEILNSDEQAISTLPMSLMAKFVGAENAPEFKYEKIVVKRWRIPNADVYQTIYFPEYFLNVYRASITGDLLIAEYIKEEDDDDYELMSAFGLNKKDCIPIEKVSQKYGKIAKIDEEWRKKFIYELSAQHNIFSLGRFSTWKNILVDDAMKDIQVIKKLMNSNIYEQSMIKAK